MEIMYKRNIKQSFMVLSADEIVTDYQIEMCTRNKIAGLLEMETVVADGKLQFWYDITGKQSLEEYMKNHPMEESLFVYFLGAIRDIIVNLNGYLLEENHIQLEMRTIYIDHANQQFYFCYFPKERKPLTENFHLLMEYLLTRIEHGDKQVVAIAYEAYQMTLQDGYSIERIYQMALQTDKRDGYVRREYVHQSIEEECRLQVQEEERLYRTSLQANNSMGNRSYNQASNSTDNQVDSQIVNGKTNLTKTSSDQLQKVKDQIKSMVSSLDEKASFWKIRKSKAEQLQMVFEPEEENCQEENAYTVFLGEQEEAKEPTRVLEYVGPESRPDMTISKSPYHIGSREDADGVIDKKSISRLHARITKEKDEYYIEDLNSRNGTWVNGELLNYLDRVHLVNGTKITFAREEYCFLVK